MQHLIDALARSLDEFIEQPDDPTLVLLGTDAALVLPTRLLSARDRQDDAHYYLLFPAPCHDANEYLRAVIGALREQLEVLDAEHVARHYPRWPDPPLELADQRQPPARRLEALIRYMGEHLPGDEPVVWGLLPGELDDIDGYAALVRPLLSAAPEPWMDRHRFILRDQRHAAAIVPSLHAEQNGSVQVIDVNLDGPSVLDALCRSAADAAVPADQRVLALVQLAAIDASHGRRREALSKYGAAFNYYSQSGDRSLQALCLVSAGDVRSQGDEHAAALERYQQSLALSVEEGNVAMLYAGTEGAGSSCLALGRDAEAEAYLVHANALAGKLHNPSAKCRVLEKLGVARFRLDRIEQAIDTWIAGKDLARQFGDHERVASIVEYLNVAYQHLGQQRRHPALAVGTPADLHHKAVC